MNIKELRELISDMPDDMLIVLSRDGEGNSYSPLADYSTGLRYRAESTWSGEIWNPDDDEDDEGPPEGSVPCLLLWPVN